VDYKIILRNKFQKKVLNKEQPIWIAVSGGIDSVAIAHFLSQHLNIGIFHFNHKLQDANDKMEEKVKELANDINVPLIVKSRTQEIVSKDSIEDAARKWRIQAMKDNLTGQIVICHHLSDAVEGYMANCLAGNPEYTPIPIKTTLNENLVLVRPFLTAKKEELLGYINEYNLNKYVVEDPTNIDLNYKRNWLRHSIIPQIEERTGLHKVVLKKVILGYNKIES
jgi:tRNA(Ile)-lysidine synthase